MQNIRSLAGKTEQSAEAELHIFGSFGGDEMRKWTYSYLEVLAEQVRTMNGIFRSPGRAELTESGTSDLSQ